MKKIVLVLFALFICLNIFGQNPGSIEDRIPRGKPTEQEIAKRNRMMKERKKEFISNFITTLEADDFQKQITRQYLNTYYDAKVEILNTPYEHRIDLKAAIKNLDDTHFSDLKALISEKDMGKINELINGEFDEKEVKNKKKKKKKKKKKDKKKDKDTDNQQGDI